MKDFNEMINKRVIDLSDKETYEIGIMLGNSGPWDELHVICGLIPLNNPDCVVWVAFPRAPFWNYLADHSNLHLPMRLPDNIYCFIKQELDVLGGMRTIYVHQNLEW